MRIGSVPIASLPKRKVLEYAGGSGVFADQHDSDHLEGLARALQQRDPVVAEASPNWRELTGTEMP